MNFDVGYELWKFDDKWKQKRRMQQTNEKSWNKSHNGTCLKKFRAFL